MKTPKFIVAVLFLLTMASCGGTPAADSAPDIAAAADSATSADSVATTMAACLAPEQSAAALVAWLQKAELGHGPYARRLTRALAEAYAGGSGAFTAAIDSLQATLPVEVQAHMLAVATTPERLAAAIAADPDGATLAQLIAEEYRSDSTLYNRFIERLPK